MDIGTTLAASNYQTALKSGGQSGAVLQALDQTYTAVTGANDGTDPLAALAGASAIGPLVSGITAMTQAANQANDTATQAAGITGVQFAPSFGGLDLNSATSLLASLGSTDNTAGLQGFSAAATAGVNLAIAAYNAQQSYPAGTQTTPSGLTAAPGTGAAPVQAAGAAPASAQSDQQNPATPAYLQQAAAAVTSPAILSLLA